MRTLAATSLASQPVFLFFWDGEKPSGDDCQLTVASARMQAEPMKLKNRLACETSSHRGHVNNLEYYGNYLKRYIGTRNNMRYVRTYGRTDVRTYMYVHRTHRQTCN